MLQKQFHRLILGFLGVFIVVICLSLAQDSFAWPGTEAPDSTITLQMSFVTGESWTVGGNGSFYGEALHNNSPNNDYYATDWNWGSTPDADLGKLVLPVADGVVATVVAPPCPTSGLGCYVEISHSDGYRTRYGHLRVVSVTQNSLVRTSTLLGQVGSTGTSSYPHLHLTFRRNGSSRCNVIPTCPNGETAMAPQGHKPSPMQTAAGSSGLTDGGTYTSINGRVYLPYLRNDGWVTTFYVRNNGTETRDVKIFYFGTNGSPTPKVSDTCNLPPTTACWIIVSEFNRIPSGTIGSAYVDGGENVSVSVTNRRTAPIVRGAYTGVLYNRISETYNIPLALRLASTASGIGSSEVTIQNTTSAAINIQIKMISSSGSTFIKPVTIPALGSYRYKLKDESSSNLPNGWVGSIIVTGGRVAISSDLFAFSEETVQTISGFPGNSQSHSWFIPLFMVRRATQSGTVSTPITVQNLSDNNAVVNVSEIYLACTALPNSGFSDFVVSNPVSVPYQASYSFNPVVDTVLFPVSGWIGSCKVAMANGKKAVVLAQNRVPTDSRNASNYNAIRGDGDRKIAIFPVIQKRLADGSATSLLVQNLGVTATNVGLQYVRGSNAASGQCTATSPNYLFVSFTIPAEASLARNHRLHNSGLPEEETLMPVGWCGSLLVTSDSQPIDGLLQLTDFNSPPPFGDTFMALNVDTR